MSTQINLANGVLHYSLDTLVARKGLIYGHGWAFFSNATVKQIQIGMRSSKGRTDLIDASYGHRRDDVKELHPGAANAQYSGFRFQAGFPDEAIQSVCLLIESEDGQSCRIPLGIKVDGDALRISSKSLAYLWLFAKAWRLVWHGQFGLLWHAVSNYATKIPRREKNLVSVIRKLFASTGTANALLIIDHDLGGGANSYRERMLFSLLSRGESALVLSFFMPTLQFFLEYRNAARMERFAVGSMNEIIALTESGLVREIFYNNAVSFHDPCQIPDLLTHLKEITSIPIRVALHDYFSICPSYYLLNDKGQYCNLPSVEECNRCLGKNNDSLVKLAGVTDIADWRKRWGRCLQVAEEILCFSEASRTILQRAYPELSRNKIALQPHTIDYLPQSTPIVNLDAPLHIGIVGNLTKPKGAGIVRALTEEIRRRGLDIPVTVIGTVDAEYHIPYVKETGRYSPERLSQLIERSGANLFLFPSIVPETFSYVVSELITLNVPVVCFDLGAPAERVRGYKLGHVIAYDGPCALLDTLRSIHTRLAAQPMVTTGEQS